MRIGLILGFMIVTGAAAAFGASAKPLEVVPRADGAIDVVNACRKNTLDGKESSIRGKAWIVDKTTNAKLKVQFFWPFAGVYWIIELDKDYQWAVVGHPDRTYYWILSRTP